MTESMLTVYYRADEYGFLSLSLSSFSYPFLSPHPKAVVILLQNKLREILIKISFWMIS